MPSEVRAILGTLSDGTPILYLDDDRPGASQTLNDWASEFVHDPAPARSFSPASINLDRLSDEQWDQITSEVAKLAHRIRTIAGIGRL